MRCAQCAASAPRAASRRHRRQASPQAPNSWHPLVRTRARPCFARGTRASADKLCRDVVSTPKAPVSSEGKTYKITLLTKDNSGTTIECPDDEYILSAAESNGIDLPATCRGGICGACVARVAKGEVDMSDVDDLSFTLDEDEIKAGMALLCMSRPKSDVVLETQCDWGLSLGFKEWEGASGKLVGEVAPLMGKKWTELGDDGSEKNGS